jgi:hypothetical protein
MQHGTGTGHDVGIDSKLEGFRVVHGGDHIGKVDHVNYTGTCVSVQTGGLLKKTRRLIPSSAIRSIDLDSETIDVALTADEVGEAPEFDDHLGIDDECETRVAAYYEGLPPR